MIYRIAIFALAVLFTAPAPALAADLPVKAPLVTGSVGAGTSPEYGNVYFGVDANTNQGLAGYTGVLYAPWGLNVSGLRLSAFALGGAYRYFDDTPQTFRGRFVSIDLLAGYSSVFNNGAVTFAVGVNYQDHRIRPLDIDNPVQGSQAGAKIQADFWMNPTERTLLLGIASFSTAFNTYYAIGRAGYDFFGTGTFIGPEVVGLGNARTDQQRLGLHITGIPVLPNARLTLSGGYLRERNERDGVYGTANLDFTF